MEETLITDDERFYLCILLANVIAKEENAESRRNCSELLRKLIGVDKRVVVQELKGG